MSAMIPYTATSLTRLLTEAKANIERGQADLVAIICHELLPWAGRAEVDRTLGLLLKLLMRHGSAAKVAEIEVEAFPLDRLRRGWNPVDVSIAYLNWKYRQAFGQEQDPDLTEAKTLAFAAQALWRYLDEPTRLTHGLYAKLATVHAALGNVKSLRELDEELLAGSMTDERQQTACLRILKQLQRLRATAEVESLLEQLLARPEHNPALIEAALTAVEVLRLSAQRLSDHQRLGLLLQRLLPCLKSTGVGLIDKRLLTALFRCAEFDLLQELLRLLLPDLDDAPTRAALISVFEQLLRYDVLGDAGPHIEQVYRIDPTDPLAAVILSRLLSQQGRSSAEIAPLFKALRFDAPGHDEAVLWLAQFYVASGEFEPLTQWLETHPLNEPRKALEFLNHARSVSASCSLPLTGDGAETERLNVEALGPLASVLTPLTQELNGDWSYSAHSPLADLSSRLHGIILALEKAVASPGFDLVACLHAARELVRVGRVHLREMLTQYQTTPTALGPQYGVLDAARVRALYEALHQVAMRLSEYGIEAALRDAPLPDVRYLCQLADIHMQSAFELGEVRSSEGLLHMLRECRVAPVLMSRLLERCTLQRGDLQAAAELAAGQPGVSGEMFNLEPFDTWARLEAVESEYLINQEPEKGAFEYIDSQGNFHQALHEVPATQVYILKIQGLCVRDTELLIGPKGSILRPHPWHYRDVYGYPRPSSIRINYGHRGCRLRPPSERLRVHEPVVVFANMDGPYYRNYYHWMLLILTRVAVLLDRGVFEHRRLLVPVELPNWMTASLELAGLPQERMLLYKAEQEVLTEDAWVVSSVEYAAAALTKSLQQRLWEAAGVNVQGEKPRRAVWLSRRKQYWRVLANVEVIEMMAQRLGFEVIAPESLSLVDQVRLCASSAIIAGPGGANLTNLLFARPGTRILGLVSESNNFPGFIDLCTAMDLPSRWLFCRADPRKARGGPMHESFEANVTVLERELRRLVSVI